MKAVRGGGVRWSTQGLSSEGDGRGRGAARQRAVSERAEGVPSEAPHPGVGGERAPASPVPESAAPASGRAQVELGAGGLQVLQPGSPRHVSWRPSGAQRVSPGVHRAVHSERGTHAPSVHTAPAAHAVPSTQSVQPVASVAQTTGSPRPAQARLPAVHWSLHGGAVQAPPEHTVAPWQAVAGPNERQPVAPSCTHARAPDTSQTPLPASHWSRQHAESAQSMSPLPSLSARREARARADSKADRKERQTLETAAADLGMADRPTAHAQST